MNRLKELLNNLGGAIVGALTGGSGSFSTAKNAATAEDYMNRNTTWGSYARAQEKANEYMSANKERIPMVIEYLASPGNRMAVTMYINPSRLQFKNQKIKSKTVTRGGIFYHHWGDDNMVMSLSGSCGFSGMSGIKKIDEIYRMSGVLLAYGTNNQGPVYTNGDTALLNSVMAGDWKGALTTAISGKKSLTDIGAAVKQHAIGGAIDAVTGRRNSGLQSSKLAQKCGSYIGGTIQKWANTASDAVSGALGDSAIADFAGKVVGDLTTSYANGLIGKLGSRGSTGNPLAYLDENVVTYHDAYAGFNDIIDELEDPWRPRQVWIYFEDHVYIGHFDSFSYTRVAETMNISYEMNFTVIREIIVTSYKASLPGFVPARVV